MPPLTRLLCPAAHLSEGLYCSGIANLVVLQASSQGLIVVAILAINFLLAFTSRKLTVFEKHHTRSSEARSLAHKLFLAQVGHTDQHLEGTVSPAEAHCLGCGCKSGQPAMLGGSRSSCQAQKLAYSEKACPS